MKFKSCFRGIGWGASCQKMSQFSPSVWAVGEGGSCQWFSSFTPCISITSVCDVMNSIQLDLESYSGLKKRGFSDGMNIICAPLLIPFLFIHFSPCIHNHCYPCVGDLRPCQDHCCHHCWWRWIAAAIDVVQFVIFIIENRHIQHRFVVNILNIDLQYGMMKTRGMHRASRALILVSTTAWVS